jgi:hypothetical protein
MLRNPRDKWRDPQWFEDPAAQAHSGSIAGERFSRRLIGHPSGFIYPGSLFRVVYKALDRVTPKNLFHGIALTQSTVHSNSVRHRIVGVAGTVI